VSPGAPDRSEAAPVRGRAIRKAGPAFVARGASHPGEDASSTSETYWEHILLRYVGDVFTERWAYRDDSPRNNQVVDGIDTFLIKGGKIRVKMIHYTVEKAQASDEFHARLGQGRRVSRAGRRRDRRS